MYIEMHGQQNIKTLIHSWQHLSVPVNQLQANSSYTHMVHSVNAHIMGSHIVYKPFLF